MVFKKVKMEYGSFDSDNYEELKSIIMSNCSKYSGPLIGLN